MSHSHERNTLTGKINRTLASFVSKRDIPFGPPCVFFKASKIQGHQI